MSVTVERAALTLAVVLAILACLGLMRMGWVRRARRQADIPPLPRVTDVPAPSDPRDITDLEARFLGTNRAGNWLDRVVVHGLGVPSTARVSVRMRADKDDSGVWVKRQGAPEVFIGADDLLGARHDRAVAGRAVEPEAVVVVSWRHRAALLELGLRVRDASRAEELCSVIDSLANVHHGTGDRA